MREPSTCRPGQINPTLDAGSPARGDAGSDEQIHYQMAAVSACRLRNARHLSFNCSFPDDSFGIGSESQRTGLSQDEQCSGDGARSGSEVD